MLRFELAPPRHLPPAGGGGSCRWVAWLEAALLVRVAVPAWAHVEESWVHWAFRLAPDGGADGRARPFDPAARAALPGAPPAALRPGVGESEARAIVGDEWARWRPALHRHPDLGVVSRLGESADAFRRRCLSPLRPLARRGGADAATVAARLGELAAGVESMRLGAENVEVRAARVAVAWYPEGTEPAPLPDDPMVAGAVRESR